MIETPDAAPTANARVLQIFVTPEAGTPMQRVPEARAVPGHGLEGDRYYSGTGSLSRWSPGKRQMTLIAKEDLDALEAETGVRLEPEESRRNVFVEGLALNDLLKRTFRVGEVEVEGVRLCQPCKYLERKTGKSLIPAMIGRGGLRVRILSEGVIREGDHVETS